MRKKQTNFFARGPIEIQWTLLVGRSPHVVLCERKGMIALANFETTQLTLRFDQDIDSQIFYCHKKAGSLASGNWLSASFSLTFQR
jgi:hypothetical protein